MNKTLAWTLGIIAIIIIIFAGFYLCNTTATVTMVVPNGGETWVTGSTHTISWTTRGIPADDKISITIRRIPPPALQEEGQEFDPIIAINLANTGSYEWTLADMYPSGTYVLGLQSYASLPITESVSAESAPFQIVHPLAQDLYPLYNQAEWGVPGFETFLISTTTYSGTSVSSVIAKDTMNQSSIFSPFDQYYASKLASLGWTVENGLAAGGHTGGQTGYRKGDELVLVRFNVLYKTVTNTAPSECPCDVTLSLFSAD